MKEAERGFTKERSGVVKGVAIIMLLLYHVLGNTPHTDEIQYFLLPAQPVTRVFETFGVCISVYVLISAYGITGKLIESDNNSQKYTGLLIKRIVSIMMTSFAVYVTVILPMIFRFDVKEIYQTESVKNLVVFGFLEAVGLSQFTNTGWIVGSWWYLALAIEIVLVVPVIHLLHKKIGNLVIAVAFLIAMLEGFTEWMLNIYIVVIAVGVCAAEENWIARIENQMITEKGEKWKRLLCSLMTLLALCIVTRFTYPYRNGSYSKASPVSLAIIALGVILIVCLAEPIFPRLSKVLAALGKHSMNIYLVHELLFRLLFEDFYYGMHYGIAIVGSVLVSCLVYSIVLQWIKKIIKYDQWPQLICDRLSRKQKG